MKIHYHPKLTTFSRELRKSGTLAEVLLWKELKGKKLKGCRFLRQKPIEGFIVDFFCPTFKLVIEIDGVSHDSKMERDEEREKSLERIGFSVLRFTEGDVRNNLDGVVRIIEEEITPLASQTRHSPC